MEKRYEVTIAGQTESTYATKEEAEKRLFELRHSFYALVHPYDCFYIREKKS